MFAERFRQERIRLGFTQPEIGKICDVSVTSVVRWEKGTPIPSDKLELLGNAGWDIHYLLFDQRRRLESENGMPEDEKKLLAHYCKLLPSDKVAILRIIELCSR